MSDVNARTGWGRARELALTAPHRSPVTFPFLQSSDVPAPQTMDEQSQGMQGPPAPQFQPQVMAPHVLMRARRFTPACNVCVAVAPGKGAGVLSVDIHVRQNGFCGKRMS